jgi:acetamidase/formamidase
MSARADAHGHKHTIHGNHQHLSWDNGRPPAITVAPGDTVEFKDMDATSGQLTAKSTVKDIGTLDFSLINPIAGPVYVDGAVPGDALKVTLLSFDPSGWAWTAIVPGFGLLAEEFTQPALNIWTFDRSFAAPAEPGSHSTIPPHNAGGNMDIRDLTVGVDLYLPVRVKGALFSVGDPHAAQGDGEVCGTAIESPMSVTAKFDLIKGANLRFPRFVTHGPVTRHLDSKGYEVTTGIGPELMEATRNAVRGMIDLLGSQHGMSPENAYMLCSVCADMRISEVVDRPNWVVSCYLPRLVFE